MNTKRRDVGIGACRDERATPSSVDHPTHYNSHPSGVEAIAICEHMTFNVGNAMKYLWRAGLKNENPVEDLQKAAWYVAREIYRLESRQSGVCDHKEAP